MGLGKYKTEAKGDLNESSLDMLDKDCFLPMLPQNEGLPFAHNSKANLGGKMKAFINKLTSISTENPSPVVLPEESDENNSEILDSSEPLNASPTDYFSRRRFSLGSALGSTTKEKENARFKESSLRKMINGLSEDMELENSCQKIADMCASQLQVNDSVSKDSEGSRGDSEAKLLEAFSTSLGLGEAEALPKESFNSLNSIQSNLSEVIKFMLQTAVDVIILADSFGRIVFANRTIARLMGYKPKEVIGQNLTMLMSGSHAKNHDKYIQNYLLTGKTKVIGKGRDVQAKRKDGSTFSVHLAVSAFNSDGRVFFSGILRDITDKRNAEKYAEREVDLLKSQKLLYDILPPHIVQGVQDGNSVAERCEDICMMFADIVAFTQFCSDNPPELVVDVLNGIYFLCDATVEKYPNAFKIKFIGDCVLVCTGLIKNEEHKDNETLTIPCSTQSSIEGEDRVPSRRASVSSAPSCPVRLTPRTETGNNSKQSITPEITNEDCNALASETSSKRKIHPCSSFEGCYDLPSSSRTGMENPFNDESEALVEEEDETCLRAEHIRVQVDQPPSNEEDIVRAVTVKRNVSEMVSLCWNLKKELKYFCRRNLVDVKMRFGLNVGPVIAGVLGKRRPVYDVWGDAVNVASRMESKSEPGRILAPYDIANVVSDKYDLVGVREIQVKGKGIMSCAFIEKRAKDPFYSDEEDAGPFNPYDLIP
eukprot:Nk52_evm27s232 gene=Nk52_evmTU27s232